MLIMAQVLLFALFPILINHTTKTVSPILFAGLSNLMAAAFLLFWLFFTKKTSELLHKKAFPYILGITLFIIIIPCILIYTGSSMTSGINTSILLQTEILFTFLILGLWRHEKITKRKILGASLVTIGAIMVLYNGTLRINLGDLLIIIGTAFSPIGNILAQKAMKMVSPATILFMRSLIGGMTLITISLFFENQSNPTALIFSDQFYLLFINGILMYGVSKILWYEGLKRINISKAISLGMTHPGFGLLYAYLFLKEIPRLFQLLGLLVILGGVFFITRLKHKKEPIELTL